MKSSVLSAVDLLLVVRVVLSSTSNSCDVCIALRFGTSVPVSLLATRGEGGGGGLGGEGSGRQFSNINLDAAFLVNLVIIVDMSGTSMFGP